MWRRRSPISRCSQHQQTRSYDPMNKQATHYRQGDVLIELPPNGPPTRVPTISVASAPAHEVSSDSITMSAVEPKAPSPTETAQRQLLVYFFQLRTPQRYEAAFKAALLRDGDDALDPQVMWAEVFRRAHDENKLSAFWAAVAAHTPPMKDKPNPFARSTPRSMAGRHLSGYAPA